MKKIISAMLVFVIITALFASCGGSSSIIGKWKNKVDGSVMEFRTDNSYTLTVDSEDHSGTYDLNGRQMVLKYQESHLTYETIVNGATMTMESANQKTEWERVE